MNLSACIHFVHYSETSVSLTPHLRLLTQSRCSVSESGWCRLRDLNPRPSDYKSDALPAELNRQCNAYNIWNQNIFQVKNEKFCDMSHLNRNQILKICFATFHCNWLRHQLLGPHQNQQKPQVVFDHWGLLM